MTDYEIISVILTFLNIIVLILLHKGQKQPPPLTVSSFCPFLIFRQKVVAPSRNLNNSFY